MPNANQLIEATGKLSVAGVRGCGTAWCCSPNRLLTAAHCLKKEYSSELATDGITIDFKHRMGVRATVIWVDLALDAAILEIPPETGREIAQIRLASLAQNNGIVGDGKMSGWYAFGFPKVWTEGLYITGSFKGVLEAEKVPTIQVDCDQGGYDELAGVSGAAVCFRGSAVGLIRSAILNEKVIFVSPIDAIRSASSSAVKWGENFGVHIQHPLHAVPPGPMPDPSQISDELIRTFARLNQTPVQWRSCLQRAIRIRYDADPDDDQVTVPDMIDLPMIADTPISFWQALFHECCCHGPRMVYALIEAQPTKQFNNNALADRARLITYLSSLWESLPVQNGM